jgi:hypothetical protein
MEMIEQRRIIDKEHEAWTDWCEEFKRATGKPITNKENNKLVGLIEKWGYALIELRKEQPEYQSYEKGNLFGKYLKAEAKP